MGRDDGILHGRNLKKILMISLVLFFRICEISFGFSVQATHLSKDSIYFISNLGVHKLQLTLDEIALGLLLMILILSGDQMSAETLKFPKFLFESSG